MLICLKGGKVKSPKENRVQAHSGMVECKLENCSDALFVRSIMPYSELIVITFGLASYSLSYVKQRTF